MNSPTITTQMTDECSLSEVVADSSNLILNPGFESTGANGNPLNWIKGVWGTSSAVFSYPVAGVQNSKAAKVAITDYTDGDAKWIFDPVVVTRCVYTYSTAYLSNLTTAFVARYQYQDNSFINQNVGTVAPSSTFITKAIDIWVPLPAKNITIYHLVQGAGELTIDDTSLKFKSAPTGIFTTGAVSLTFDDGYLSQYQNAVPKMNAAGFKGTFYIITRQMADDGFSAYMSKAQVAELSVQGHEIGAHTRTFQKFPCYSSKMR